MAMEVVTVCGYVILFFGLAHTQPFIHPDNGLKKCRTDSSVPALEVLPGGGWDNLRNLDMGRVMNLSYSQCQTTEDGLYFIPDEVFVIPQKETGVETSSEIISTWLEQKSSTSFTINSDMSFLPWLNAKFSDENIRMKTHQVKDTSSTARVQVRDFLYTVMAYPDFTLDSRFIHRTEEITVAIENNQTKYADYLSEKMVLDYGTHVITSVDAGASLVGEDYLKSSYVSSSESDISSIKLLAGLNFFDKIKFEISSNNTQQRSDLHTYQSNIQYSLTQSHGGVPFFPGITLERWQGSTKNNLVAIDRIGLPLHFFINTNTFPELPNPTVTKVALSVQQAIEHYYKINTRPGCVNIASPNFNFQANVDDGSCEGPVTSLGFGGIYQTCSKLTADADPLCKELEQMNPETGNYSCREPYFPVHLRSEVRHQPYSKAECRNVCHSCGFLSLYTCCDLVCERHYYVRSAQIDTNWCVVNGTAPVNSGYLFGGFYGPSFINPLTNSQNCPPKFFPLNFLSDGLRICLSKEYETDPKYSAPFGGMFSCESSNPLGGGEQRCPPQFSQHLIAISDGCQVLYCTHSSKFTSGQLLPIHLPPFTQPPTVSILANNTVVVITEGVHSWIKVADSMKWKRINTEDIQNAVHVIFPGQSEAKPGQLSRVSEVAIGCGVGLMALVIAGVVFVAWKMRQGRVVLGSGNREGNDESEERQVLVA